MRGYIVHSAKGTTWSDHKYIRKDGDRYIYSAKEKYVADHMAEDVTKGRRQLSDTSERISGTDRDKRNIGAYDFNSGHIRVGTVTRKSKSAPYEFKETSSDAFMRSFMAYTNKMNNKKMKEL